MYNGDDDLMGDSNDDTIGDTFLQVRVRIVIHTLSTATIPLWHFNAYYKRAGVLSANSRNPIAWNRRA